MSTKYLVCRADRSSSPVAVGQTLYVGNHDYGIASEDSRMTGIEHISLCKTEEGSPTFTIPKADVLRVAEIK